MAGPVMRKAYICLPSWLDTNATFYWIYYTEWGTFQYYLFSLPLIFCMSAGGYLQEIIRINWATNRVLFDHSCFIIIIIFNYYYYSINLEKKERKTESKISGPSFVGENYDPQSQVHMQICFGWMNWEIPLRLFFPVSFSHLGERDKRWF